MEISSLKLAWKISLFQTWKEVSDFIPVSRKKIKFKLAKKYLVFLDYIFFSQVGMKINLEKFIFWAKNNLAFDWLCFLKTHLNQIKQKCDFIKILTLLWQYKTYWESEWGLFKSVTVSQTLELNVKPTPQGIFFYYPPNKTEKDWKNSVTLLSCDTAVQIDQIKKGVDIYKVFTFSNELWKVGIHEKLSLGLE